MALDQQISGDTDRTPFSTHHPTADFPENANRRTPEAPAGSRPLD